MKIFPIVLAVLITGSSFAQTENTAPKVDHEFNFYINPTSIFFQNYLAGFAKKISSRMTLGGRLLSQGKGYLAQSDIESYRSNFVGAESFYSLTDHDIFADGWVLRIALLVGIEEGKYKSDDKYSENSWSSLGIATGVEGGYGLYWNNGFNIQLAIGIQRLPYQLSGNRTWVYRNGKKISEKQPGRFESGVPGGDFNVGYRF